MARNHPENKDPETWKPRQWRNHTKRWNEQAIMIAKAMYVTHAFQVMQVDRADKLWNETRHDSADQQMYEWVKTLSRLPEQALYRMVTSFSMSACSVDSGSLKSQSHARPQRKGRR